MEIYHHWSFDHKSPYGKIWTNQLIGPIRYQDSYLQTFMPVCLGQCCSILPWPLIFGPDHGQSTLGQLWPGQISIKGLDQLGILKPKCWRVGSQTRMLGSRSPDDDKSFAWLCTFFLLYRIKYWECSILGIGTGWVENIWESVREWGHI